MCYLELSSRASGWNSAHWIAVEISACLPIPGRLHPSHYSSPVLHKRKAEYVSQNPHAILLCRHCGGEVKDYGGHRDAMNPNGVTLKDVWTDIPPVRHWKYKSKDRPANALSTKILDRVIEMSTVPATLSLIHLGEADTTFAVCERKNRHWLGTEIDFADEIIDRLESGQIQSHKNDDFVER